MRINISVCGRFHFHNYIRFIEEAGMLEAFYYSHKRQTDYRSLGILPEHAYNFPLKEYGVQLLGRFFNGSAKRQIYPLLFSSWERAVMRYWKKVDIYHYVNHGNSLKLIQRALSEGTTVVGECVNSHIDSMRELMHQEYELLGLSERPKVYSWEQQMLEELSITPNILVPSGFVKKSLTDKGFLSEKIHVIPYGANLNRFYPPTARHTDDIFRVLVVAQVSPRKGHKYLLEAWKKLNLPHAELVFIGAMHPLMKQVLKPYAGLFTYKGIVPNEQLIQYMHRSDVFVLPSIEEGCSVAPLEAMACGLPVIVSEHTGADAYFTEGENGFTVPVRSVDALAQRLLQLYQDSDLRQYIREQNILKTSQDLSWANYAQKLMQYYQNL